MSRAWNLADVFECVAGAVPGREAVVSGARRLTFAALDERANRLARYLAAAGVESGDRVGVDLYNGSEYLEVSLAAWKLRAVAVNVNYRYTPAELAYLLDDAGATAVVYDTSVGGSLREAAARLPGLRVLVSVGEDGDYEEALASVPPAGDFPPRSSDDLYLLYTGGTTGPPKGVMWRHEDILFAGLLGAEAATLGRPEAVGPRARAGGRRVLPVTPLMHGTGQWTALAALFGGGTVVLSGDRSFDPVRLWGLVATEGVEVIALVGDATARPLLDALPAAPGDLSCVRFVLSSGAVLSPAVKEAFSRHLPGVVVIDTYGSSESGPQARAIGGDGFVGDGRTVVLDDDLRALSPGSGLTGRLARSGYVALGYWNDPARTAATFPVLGGVRYAVTGDHGRIEADGTITLLGRGSACINTGGEKVYPEEVEGVLKAHPDVFDALVVGLPDERFGERVAALVVARPGRSPSPAELAAHARTTLAGYKVPRAVAFVAAVRRSASGKPDYRWAKEQAARLLR